MCLKLASLSSLQQTLVDDNVPVTPSVRIELSRIFVLLQHVSSLRMTKPRDEQNSELAQLFKSKLRMTTSVTAVVGDVMLCTTAVGWA